MTPAEYMKRLQDLRNKIGAASKVAFAPPGAAPMPDPAMMGGAPPMDPAMIGGAPMDPAMMGGAPPVDPAMAGGVPPMDPAMAGGMPMDPAMMGGAPPMDPAMMGGAPMDPAMMGGVPPMAPTAAGMPPEGMGEDPIMKLTDMVNALGFMVGRIIKYFGIPLDEEGKAEDDAAVAENAEAAEQAFIPEEEQGELDQLQDQMEEQNDPLSQTAEDATDEPTKSDFIKRQLAQFGA